MRLIILILLALPIVISIAAADTEVAINLNLKAKININDANFSFQAQNASENIATKANEGDVISKKVSFNITAPFQWSVTLITANGTKILDLNGVGGLNWARYETVHLDNAYLAIIDDTPAVIITAQAVEARLMPTLTLKDYSDALTIDIYLDSNGDNLFEDFEHASKTVKPDGNTLETDFPPFASATQTARYLVNISEGIEQVAMMSGTYNFKQAVAVSDGQNYIDSSKITSASLGVEYRTGTIVIDLPNEAFSNTNGNITAVSGNYLEISLKSNKSVISNSTGELSVNVVSNVTKTPVEGAIVSVYNAGELVKSNITDGIGIADFNSLPESDYKVTVENNEYYPKTENYTIGLRPVKAIVELQKKPTFFDKVSGMARSSLSNPLLSGAALLVAIIAIFLARRR